MIGRAVGHYVIQEQLAQGGMGVVFRARDTRLNREVVLKALRHDRSSNPERARRLADEAQAVSALNHPNIVTVYDLATDEEGRDYIVMEYVRGESLDRVLANGCLALTEVLRYGIQMADALATAHAAGIIHRDLKPANIVLTSTGSVKVLDFGLVRVTERVRMIAAGDVTGTISPDSTETMQGAVLGTAAYMSPEQAEGRVADARSDIFSLGCVLYELATARRAFFGETPMLTLTAVIRDEPEPVTSLCPELPATFEAVVHRCLRKNPLERYQSMAEVKAALELVAAPPAANRVVRPWVFAAALLLVLTLWLVRSNRQAPAQWQVAPLTSFPGLEMEPALSPDGDWAAFIWDGDVRGARDLYVRSTSGGEAVRLTSTNESEYSPSWSPDGRQVAFFRSSESQSELIIVPSAGGAERIVSRLPGRAFSFDSPPRWSPDGSYFVVALERSPDPLAAVDARTGDIRILTYPELGYSGDTRPVFSSDGTELFFIRRRNVWNHAIFRMPVRGRGEPAPVTGWDTAYRGVAALPGGDNLVASGMIGARYVLMRIGLHRGESEPLGVEPISAINPTLSRNGRRLAYERTITDINLWMLPGPNNGTELRDAVRLIASTYIDREPTWSPDGRRFAFVSTRSGGYEIWISSADGREQNQVTRFETVRLGSPQWSPDGRYIAFDAYTEGRSDVYVVEANGGSPQRLTRGPRDAIRPAWSHDSQWIYYVAGGQIAKVRPDGSGDSVLPWDGSQVRETADGRYLLLLRGSIVYRVAEGRAAEAVAFGASEGMWTSAGQHVYVRNAGGITRYHSETLMSEPVHVFISNEPEPPRGASLAVSADERLILFSRLDRSERDIMLVENFSR